MADTSQRDDEETGRLAGFGAGVITGAQIGTILIPVPLVGTFTGALIGGVIGSRVGQRVGPALFSAVDNLTQALPASPSPQRPTSIPISSSETDSPIDTDLLSQLERLGQLRSQGLLTEDEFAAAKAQLLKR